MDHRTIVKRLRATGHHGLADKLAVAHNSVVARETKHKLNKYDPGSLLGRVVWLLDEAGLDDAAKDVRRVSSVVQRAWRTREK